MIKKLYFFMHIPKTAGTSFRNMLWSLFKQKEIIPNANDIKKRDGLFPEKKIIKKEFKKRFTVTKLLTGHYHFGITKMFDNKKIIRLVFLRNPFERSLSELFHIKTNNNNFINSSFEEIIKKCKKQFLNRQTRFFLEYNKMIIKKDDFKLAKNNLLNCDFIGITEYFNESIKLAEEQFEWKLGKIRKDNVNNKYTINDLSKKEINMLKESIKYDNKLYKIALKEFKKRLKKHGIKIDKN